MNAALQRTLAPAALRAADVRRWFETGTPIDIIDAQLMQSMASRQGIAADCACEIFAIIDQHFRRGTIDAAQFRRLKARIHPAVIGRPDASPATPRPAADAPRPAPHVASAPAPSKPSPTPASKPVAVAAPAGGFLGAALVRGRSLCARYVIEAPIGEGGMSSVYRALDRRREALTGHSGLVALKVLRPALAARPEAIKALRQEFERAQRLSHPVIVNVFDLDVEGDIHFFTMELLKGDLLSEVIRRMRPTTLQRELALRVLGQLADAIAYAHDCGIIHADIKPGNVMLTQDGEVRLFDFGTAWVAQREPWIFDAAMYSLQGATPGYASPERLTGAVPTSRDDIFSFCCLAYELLSGNHPFDRRPASEACDLQLRPARVPGLSRRQWKALRAGLSWTRAARPADMHALALELGLSTKSRLGRLPRLLRAELPARESLVLGLSMLLIGILALAATQALYADTPWHRIPAVAAVTPWIAEALQWLRSLLPR